MFIILETAVQDDKVMEDFELESLLMGGDHSQKVKEPSIRSDSNSKDCVNLASSTAVSRIMRLCKKSIIYHRGTKNKIGRIALGGRMEKYIPILPPKAILPIPFFCSLCLCVSVVDNALF
jgi:hypothetical protein